MKNRKLIRYMLTSIAVGLTVYMFGIVFAVLFGVPPNLPELTEQLAFGIMVGSITWLIDRVFLRLVTGDDIAEQQRDADLAQIKADVDAIKNHITQSVAEK